MILKYTEIQNWNFKEFYDNIASVFCDNFEIQNVADIQVVIDLLKLT